MELNNKNIRKILFLIIFTAIILWIVLNSNQVYTFFCNFIDLIFPFILGIGIAFVLNLFVNLFEKKLFVKRKKEKDGSITITPFKHKKLIRIVSMILAILVLIAIVTFVFTLVIPELINTVKILISSLPEMLEDGKGYMSDLFVKYPELNSQFTSVRTTIENFNVNDEINKFISSYGTGLLATSWSIISNAITGILTFIISLAFSLYALAQKEKLLLQAKKILYAYIKKEQADKIMKIAQTSNTTFSNFLAGQFLEALILGTLCMTGMLILRIPYALTIGVLISFTALIPIVGAIIGASIGVILILGEAPVKALVFLIYLLILQEIEGKVIYPKVVGTSVGLPGIWVLVAIVIGGSLGGLLGVLLSVPVSSVIYAILRENVYQKLKEQKIEIK